MSDDGKSGGKSGDEPEVGTLVKQPHGGALLHGSKPGHPATGRPPSALRGSLRQVLDKSIVILEELVEKGPDDLPAGVKLRDVLKAIDLAARYGLGPPKVGYDEELVDELAAAVHSVLSPREDGAELMEQIKRLWVPVLARKKTE